MIVFPDQATAERARDAIRAMLLAVGNVQAGYLHESADFAGAEAQAVSLRPQTTRWIIHIDLEAARRGRDAGESWVLWRLYELATAGAEVSPVLRPDVTRLAFGVTLSPPERYFIPGAGAFRLPGPYHFINISVSTRHPLTRVNRSDLDIGRTLVHELVVHAWREAFFYQPRPRSADPPASPGADSTHFDFPHTTRAASDGSLHNYADAEADLLDYYYFLGRGDTLQHAEANHPGFSRAIGLLGGTMGSHVPSFPQYRRPSLEYSREQARFLEQARAAARQCRRMEELEERITR